MKEMVLAGFVDFINQMLSRGFSRRSPENGAEKKNGLECLLAAVRLGLDWLDKAGLTGELQVISRGFGGLFTAGGCVMIGNKALPEDVEVKGMQSFVKVTEHLDFTEPVNTPDVNVKRRGFIHRILNKYQGKDVSGGERGFSPMNNF